MCKHHWILDFHDKGICKKCSKEKEFSQPLGRLTRKEITLVRALGNAEYYMQGALRVDNEKGYLSYKP